MSEELHDIDIILVADVIYNEEITKAFLDVLHTLVNDFCDHGVEIYISLEKRFRTDLEGHIVAPSFEKFSNGMKNFEKLNPQLNVHQQPLDFYSTFKEYYFRVEELLLYKIDLNLVESDTEP